jgi:hypothetical protein
MHAAGVPLEQNEFEERLIVYQDRQPLVNSIASHWLTRNYMGVIIQYYVTIGSNSGIPFRLNGIEVNLPWSDMRVELMQDPADPLAPQTYGFPRQTSGGFDKSEVLIQSAKTLTHGQSVYGFVFGQHPDPIPPSFRHGTEVPVVLTIEDQFGEFYSRELFLTVDRSAESGPKPKPLPSRGSLFDKADGPEREAQPESEPVLAKVIGLSSRTDVTKSERKSCSTRRTIHLVATRARKRSLRPRG